MRVETTMRSPTSDAEANSNILATDLTAAGWDVPEWGATPEAASILSYNVFGGAETIPIYFEMTKDGATEGDAKNAVLAALDQEHLSDWEQKATSLASAAVSDVGASLSKAGSAVASGLGLPSGKEAFSTVKWVVIGGAVIVGGVALIYTVSWLRSISPP